MPKILKQFQYDKQTVDSELSG